MGKSPKDYSDGDSVHDVFGFIGRSMLKRFIDGSKGKSKSKPDCSVSFPANQNPSPNSSPTIPKLFTPKSDRKKDKKSTHHYEIHIHGGNVQIGDIENSKNSKR